MFSMLWRPLRRLLVCLLVGFGLSSALTGGVLAQDFLPAEEAFRLELRVGEPQGLETHFRVARGTYLYRERMEARWRTDGAGAEQALVASFPPGERKHDPTFDKVMELYHDDVVGRWALPEGTRSDGELTVVYQGCADAGLCYPPQTRRFNVAVDPQGQIIGIDGRSPMRAAAVAAGADTPDTDATTRALASGHWLKVVPVFMLAGVLLSLTPCVLPMVPILSSIIVGQAGPVGRGRGFALALSYSQGMALVYTALGLAAGWVGQGLAAYLQHPWVLLGVAALIVVLALSMFGLYELRLPARVQTWLGEGSRRLPGGRFVSVFLMGAVSALIVSPCVSAPLAGALVYISQTRDVVLGGTALYAMAWGMSLPLLLVGLSAGRLLPRAGRWMNAVKVVFGVVMLLMAAWISRPAWPTLVEALGGSPAASVAREPAARGLAFTRVRNAVELDAAVAEAARQQRPVMLDFYADWCVSCKEMEHFTFTDPQVRERLAGVVLLQADVTANSDTDRELLRRFGLFGPPGILFYGTNGQLIQGVRVIGFQKAEAFLKSLQAAGL